MPLFETSDPVEPGTIAPILLERFGLVIGKRIKASQNTTFAATAKAVDGGGVSLDFAVRATPDPDGVHYRRICNELTFVEYLRHTYNLAGVCGPVRPTVAAPQDQDQVTTEDGHPAAVRCVGSGDSTIVIVVFEWAKGSPVDFCLLYTSPSPRDRG